MGRRDQTHLEETVEKLGLAFVWLIGYLDIPEEKVREGIAQLAKEQADADDKLVRELGDELGKVLDPLFEQAKADVGSAIETMQKQRRSRARHVRRR